MLSEGATAEYDYTVTEADTAVALGSGDVPVLGTPRVLALVEQATVQLVGSHLEEGETSVGVRVELDHLLPTRVGETVRVSAVLAGASGRRLTFEVRVHDADERALAVGVVIRAVAPRSRFA